MSTIRPSGFFSRDVRFRDPSVRLRNMSCEGGGNDISLSDPESLPLGLYTDGPKAVAGSGMLRTDEVPRWRLPVLLRVREPWSRAAVSGVAISAASCLARAMSLFDGKRFFLAKPPGVAVLASEGSRILLSPGLKRENPPPRGDMADSAIGVAATASGVGSSAVKGAPLAPKEVISLSEAFLAVSLPDPVTDGGDRGGLLPSPALGGSVSRACCAA